MSGTAAGVAARGATARALTARGGAGAPSNARQAAATRQQLRAAQSLVKLFSGMRGAAMKVDRGWLQAYYTDEQGRNFAIYPGFASEYRLRTRRFDPEPYALDGSATPAGSAAA